MQVLWVGAPHDSEKPDEIVLALKTPTQARELYAQLRNEAEHMEATGRPGQIVLRGRIRK